MIFKAIFLAIRPKTLSAAVLPVLAVAAYVYPADLYLCLYAVISALCIQIASNLFNDAIDFKKGADTEERIGPKRATQMQWLTEKQVMAIAYFFCFQAILFALPLIAEGGLLILILGLVSLALAYLYTGGPYPLAYYGLGDLFVFLFFGLVATMATYYLYDKSFSFDIFVLAMQCGFLCTCLIAINNLRDVESDKKVNKHTLAVIKGSEFVKKEILYLYSFSFLLQGYWLIEHRNFVFILPYLLLVPTFFLIKNIFTVEPSAVYNRYLAQASAIYMGFVILLSLGFLWR